MTDTTTLSARSNQKALADCLAIVFYRMHKSQQNFSTILDEAGNTALALYNLNNHFPVEEFLRGCGWRAECAKEAADKILAGEFDQS